MDERRMANLNDQLLDYYENYARVKDEDMKEAQDVFNIVKREIANNLNKHLGLKLPNIGIELFIDTGSAAEGLKVVKPNEFDVMILYELEREEDYEWAVSHSEERHYCAPGFSFICKQMRSSLEAWGRSVRPLISIANDEDQLSPSELRDYFHGAFTTIIADSTIIAQMMEKNIKLKLRPTGPSMMIEVHYGSEYEKYMSIDFIPTIVINNERFIPKSYPAIRRPDWEREEKSWQVYLWRKSYSVEEMNESRGQLIDGHSLNGLGGHRKLLMIVKAISLNQPQMSLFSSYHYKTVLFHLLNYYPWSHDWSDSKMTDRLIDYFNCLVSFIQAGMLPHYFNENVNLLGDFKEIALKNFECYISNRLKKNDIHQELLVLRKPL